MKELSVEEKAKAYDEAIKKLHEIITMDNKPVTPKEMGEFLFPELKENEDEKIRKSLLEYLHTLPNHYAHSGVCAPEWIAWLEKQCEQENKINFTFEDVLALECSMKTAKITKGGDELYKILVPLYNKIHNAYLLEKQCKQKVSYSTIVETSNGGITAVVSRELTIDGEEKSANKVEPKFHEGDFVVNGHGFIMKIVGIVEQSYQYIVIGSNEEITLDCPFSKMEESCRLWDITKDAKSGDMLVCESGWTCIFKTLVNDETFSSYCFMDNTKWFCETGSECHTLNKEFIRAYNGEIKPATKEQRKQFEKVMADAGYTFDSEKNELKKIADVRTTGYWHVEDIELKPTWSEEDKNAIQVLKDIVKHSNEIDENIYTIPLKEKLYDWLKSLRPQKQWKPSDEQIEALKTSYLYWKGMTKEVPYTEGLESLYEQLKKL